MDGPSILPYRTDALALAEWLAARARGRSAEQLRGSVDSTKAVEGTAAAAAALGLVEGGGGGLTPLGERFALADPAERRALLRDALYRYAPYRDLLRALGTRGAPAETEVRWIEAWWATQGHGSSESNRREGAAAFGRLADYAGLGEYVPGRRGRPTRIRWAPGALGTKTSLVAPATRSENQPGPAPDLFSVAVPDAPPERPAPAPLADRRAVAAPPAENPRTGVRNRVDPQVNRIAVPLAGELMARIEVPLRLPAAEKRRLLDLLELLISEE